MLRVESRSDSPSPAALNSIYYIEAERRRERAYWAEIEAEEERARERRQGSPLPATAGKGLPASSETTTATQVEDGEANQTAGVARFGPVFPTAPASGGVE